MDTGTETDLETDRGHITSLKIALNVKEYINQHVIQTYKAQWRPVWNQTDPPQNVI